MERHFSDTQREQYEALGTGAILPRAHYGQLRLTGGDRVDFLQRMTTNDIARLQPGQAAVTVLTSSTARVQFVFTVLCRADDLLVLPAGPNQTSGLAKHMRGQIFFMDNVTVHTSPGASSTGDADSNESDYTRLRLVGSEARAQLAAWHQPVADLADDAFIDYNSTLILRQDRFDLPGYELLVPTANAGEIIQALQATGFVEVEEADGETPPVAYTAAYTARRIEWGRPAAGFELTEDYNPLEVGLDWTCAENKGCYTGQEIIARQVTYDKVTRTLVGLQTTAPCAPGATITLPEGKKVGAVTSTAYSPARQSYVALAVVRRPHNVDGEAVLVESGDEDTTSPTVEATVQDLPLISDPTLAVERGA